MTRFLKSTLLSIALLCAAKSASACDLHSSYSPDISYRLDSTEHQLQLGIGYQFTNQKSDIRPAGAGNAPGQYLDSHITQIYARYELSEDFGLQLNMPLIYRDYRRIQDGVRDSGSESGLGDISLLATYIPYKQVSPDSQFAIELLGGVKLPTGDSDPLAEERAEAENFFRHGSLSSNSTSLIFGDDIALGSGSYDFVFGGQVFYAQDIFFLLASAQYSLRQEGDYEFQYGDAFFFDFGPGLRFELPENGFYSLRLNFSGETKDDDEIIGRTINDSSETTLFLGPELLFSLDDSWHLTLAADFPVERDSSVDQVVPHHRFRTAISALF